MVSLLQNGLMNRILFLCEPNFQMNREIAHGMAAALDKQGPFVLRGRTPQGRTDRLCTFLKSFNPVGVVISWGVPPVILSYIERESIPCVALHDAMVGAPPMPIMRVNYAATGRMAAEHLISKGFKHFGFVGYGYSPAHRDCFDAFAAALRKKNHDCHDFLTNLPIGSLDADRNYHPPHSLAAWLKKLPRPCAVMGFNDAIAGVIVDLCLAEGLRVPGELAVLGADNNLEICQFSSPDISSICQPYRAIGAAAVELLLAHPKGRPQKREVREFEPTDIAERGSTRAMWTEDSAVERTVEFIRRNITRPFRIGELRLHAALSSAQLAVRFQAALGRTPIMEVRAQRIALARQLLRDTDLSAGEIAQQCCFNSAVHFCHTFKELCGVSPLQFRRKTRST